MFLSFCLEIFDFSFTSLFVLFLFYTKWILVFQQSLSYSNSRFMFNQLNPFLFNAIAIDHSMNKCLLIHSRSLTTRLSLSPWLFLSFFISYLLFFLFSSSMWIEKPRQSIGQSLVKHVSRRTTFSTFINVFLDLKMICLITCELTSQANKNIPFFNITFFDLKNELSWFFILFLFQWPRIILFNHRILSFRVFAETY